MPGEMRVTSYIENEEVTRKILKHLGRWDKKVKPIPKATLGKTIVIPSLASTNFFSVNR
jgi:hypothetical protein